MATNLQVNANTQQAASAFNTLQAAITGARSAFAQLTATMNSAVAVNNQYANSVTGINTAFSRLSSMLGTVFGALTKIGVVVELVFSSLLREMDKLQGFNAIMSVTAKSTDVAAQSYEFLRRTADSLGVQFDALSSNYAKLVAALPAGTQGLRTAEKVFLGVAAAARTLHATNQDTQLMFYAVTQIASKGIVSMEELRRQLGEKLPGVIQIAAKALNTLPENLEAAIRKGIVSSEKFLPIFGDALMRTFGDSAERASQSVSASINRLTNVWVDFVKYVLDSGAGDAIVALFDALREKLSDPYLIDRFAQLIKSVADQFTQFVKKLTAEDIRTGFDQFAKGLDFVIKLLDRVVSLITWMINNAGKAGAIIGGLAGVSVGALAGPIGAAVGGVAGAAGGAYLGSSLSSTPSEQAARAQQDSSALLVASNANKSRELFKLTELIPLLQKFKGLQSFNGLDNLMKAENLNTKSLQDLNTILTSPDYKNDKQRAQAVRDYSKYGTIMSPQGATLTDVLTTGKPKITSQQKAEDSSYLTAMGLTSSFAKDLANLNTVYSKGRLSFDEYEAGLSRLIDKQPYMIQYTRELENEQSALNKATSDHISFIIGRVDLDEKIAKQMADETRMASMRSEDLKIEAELTRMVNQYAEKGYEVKETQLRQWREELRVKERIRDFTSIGEGILSRTVDRYLPAIKEQRAMDGLTKDPTSGLTEQGAKDYTLGTDPNFQGGNEWLEAQKRQLEEYYKFVDGLRATDRISEETALQAKAAAQIQYDQLRMAHAQTFFGNLASLSDSKHKQIARIGKAAAITEATINAYLAINKALATIPPPASYFVAASIGAVAFANVAKIAGFKSGGYTGDYGTDEVAGVVHGREYVVNAAATARNRQALEAMNAGKTMSNGTVVEFHNHGNPKSYTVEDVGENRIRIIARDEISKNAPKAVARSMSDANSEIAKAVTTYTTADRRR